MTEYQIAGVDVTVSTTPDQDIRCRVEDGPPGVGALVVSSDGSAELTLEWSVSLAGAAGFWRPDGGSTLHRSLGGAWQEPASSSLVRSAPVGLLHGLDGANLMTFAVTEVVEPVSVSSGVDGPSGGFLVRLQVPVTARAPVALRLDTRRVRPAECVRDVQHWWTRQLNLEPLPTPPAAREPLYCSWYAYLSEIDAATMESEARRAADLGFGVFLIDDGWEAPPESGDSFRYCGDWKPASSVFPDMRGHVERLHSYGLEVVLWYGLPLLGERSAAFGRFAEQTLAPFDQAGTAVLDPRYPQVRDHLVSRCVEGVSEWGLDGVKLDFLGMFDRPASEPGPGADGTSVPQAAQALLTTLLERIRAARPDPLVEVRLNYVGPMIRPYANLFRASDCPGDPVINRVRTVDLRLLLGDTGVVHADPMMWFTDQPAHEVALTLISTIYAVPQVSVRLAELPPDHVAVLRFWLAYWREHRDVLLDGLLDVDRPDLLYPAVRAHAGDLTIAAVYADHRLRWSPESSGDRLHVLNGSPTAGVVLDSGGARQDVDMVVTIVRDCTGAAVSDAPYRLPRGLTELAVPVGGLAELVAAPAGGG